MSILKHYKYLVKILVVELSLLIMFSCIIFSISSVNAYEMCCKNTGQAILAFDTAMVEDLTISSIASTKEKVLTKTNDEVWTTDYLNYRKGPGTDYNKIGVLDKYTKVERIGTTGNGWSQIVIDGKKYFVINDYITTKQPVITELDKGKKGDYQLYALSLFNEYGWNDSEILSLIKLWNKESGWNPKARNKHSGAYGIPQSLPGSKMKSEGSDWKTNYKTQIRWGLKYIKNRYGSPSKAWDHFCSNGWY